MSNHNCSEMHPAALESGRRCALRSYETARVRTGSGTKRPRPWHLGRGRVLGFEYQDPIGGECQ